jgi:hypothetical protein
MDMVGHQAVAQEAFAGARGVMAEKVQVETAMVRRVEDGLAVVATLGDMMGNARKNYAGTAGHNKWWDEKGEYLRGNTSPFSGTKISKMSRVRGAVLKRYDESGEWRTGHAIERPSRP